MNENNKLTLILFLVAFALIVIFEIARRVLTQRQADKLMKLFLSGDFEAFDKEMDSKMTKYFVHPFNQDFMKMNSYLARGDEKKTLEIFERFDKVRLTEQQKELVYRNAYYYFVGKADAKKARKYYSALLEITHDEEEKKSMDIMYDTYVDKGYKFLEETEKKLKDAEGQESIRLKALLAMMYANKGDDEKAKKYYAEITPQEEEENA